MVTNGENTKIRPNMSSCSLSLPPVHMIIASKLLFVCSARRCPCPCPSSVFISFIFLVRSIIWLESVVETGHTSIQMKNYLHNHRSIYQKCVRVCEGRPFLIVFMPICRVLSTFFRFLVVLSSSCTLFSSFSTHSSIRLCENGIIGIWLCDLNVCLIERQRNPN